MKNKLFKCLCINLTACILVTSMPIQATAAEKSEPTTAFEEMLIEDPTVTPEEAVTEEPAATPEEAVTEEPTATPEEAVTEEPATTPEEAVTEEPAATPEEAAIEEPTAVPSASPTAALEEDTAFKEELLKKAKLRYPGMYINKEGLFEYTDADGVLQTYDPYDPEFAKYMLSENLVTTEYEGSSTSAVMGSNTSVSPFTGKTYIHEDHVADKMIRHGIDVSKYQGNVDWNKAKAAGVEFAIVRVGFRGYGEAGNMAGDEYAVQNIKNAYQAGVKVGIYFFSQAITQAEAKEEALYCHNFLKNNGLQKYITLPVFIDYEYSPTGTSGRLYNAKLTDAQRQAICDKFAATVKGYGYEPGVYANYSMLTDDMQPSQSSTYSYMNYWIARYNNATKYSNKYCFWQYSSQGTVNGISANTVDCNFWYDNRKSINDASVSINISDECDYISNIGEVLTIYDSIRKYTLTEGKDYSVSIITEEANQNITANITITGMGNYEGSAVKKVVMARISLQEEMISTIPAQSYTGYEITTAAGLPLTISHAGEVLEEGKDYTLSYETNIEAGTAKVIINGLGNYIGEIQKNFQIVPKAITKAMVNAIPDITYTGAKITTATGLILDIKDLDNGNALTEGIDYTLTYEDNQNAGTAKVMITGKGNYKGKLTTTFQIAKIALGDAVLAPLEGVVVTIGGTEEIYKTVYTGKAIKPAVSVTVNGKLLKKTDYSISYTNNTKASEKACVTIKGKKNYTGTIQKYFTIEPKAAARINLKAEMVSLASSCIRESGSIIEPEIYVVYGGTVLEEALDYKVSCTDSKGNEVAAITKAGIYNIKITGIGAYKGAVTQKLEVLASDKKVIGKEYTNVILSQEGDYRYIGSSIKPVLKVVDKTLDDQELKRGTDYTVSYYDNKNAGVARYTIKGKGKYTGTYTGTFQIKPASIGTLVQEQAGQPIKAQNTQISLSKYLFSYNGKSQKPAVTVKYNGKKLTANTDYRLTYAAVNEQDNVIQKKNADTYQITVTFRGNYEGTAVLSYQIQPINVSKLTISVPKQFYNGSAVYPELSAMTIKLGSTKLPISALEGVIIDEWTNHTAVSKRNSKAGFVLTVAQEKNFIKDSSKKVSFTIDRRPIGDKDHSFTIGGKAVSGSNSSLVCIYQNGIKINQSNGADIAVWDTVTGKVLQEGTDYTLKYSDNKKVGTAKVTVTGIGGYNGTKIIKFKIAGKPIGDGLAYDGYQMVVGQTEGATYYYTGKAVSPSVKLYEGNKLLKKNTDYTVKYQNNIRAGEATVTVTGKGNYAGVIKQSYTIMPKDKAHIKSVKVSNIPTQKYTGKTIIPDVKVIVDGETLEKGKDYTVSVINSTRLTYEDEEGRKGVATLLITGTGNYKGILAKKRFIVKEVSG